MKKIAIGLLVVGSLAACRQPRPTQPPVYTAPAPSTNVSTPAPSAPTSGDMKIGEVEAAPSRAAEVFRSACMMGQSPQSFGMMQNPSTGTWYDQMYNIAIKDTGSVCSVIFGSTDDPQSVQASFPGEDEGVNPVRATGAVLYGQPMFAAAYTRS